MPRVVFEKLSNDIAYPAPPFHPPQMWPEFGSMVGKDCVVDPSNSVYPSIRSLLRTLKLDHKNADTKHWNPLRDLVQPGQHVLIKPNLVLHRHPKGEMGVQWMVAHASIIRAFVDYALLAVGTEGLVTIGDTPLENCLFPELLKATGLDQLMEYYAVAGFRNVEILDLRTFQTVAFPDHSTQVTPLQGDPRGYTDIDLGRKSLLQALEDERGKQNYYTLADHTVDHLSTNVLRPGLPNRYHYSGHHEYRIPNTVLDADCVISIAKLKTHKFSGVTLCLKNMIGITEGKSYLPHRRPGTPSEGGDSYPSKPSASYLGRLRLKRALLRVLGGPNAERLRQIIRHFRPAPLPHQIKSETLWGDWYGNDTIWRSTADLNLILFHANRNGLDFDRVQRSYLGVIDGIIGMDHEAPMMGLPVNSKLLIAGRDPVACDTLATWLMGYDPQRIPTIVGTSALNNNAIGRLPVDRIEVAGNLPLENAQQDYLPTRGWKERLRRSAGKW